MKGAIALALLFIGGFLLYEVVLGNIPVFISTLRDSITGKTGGSGGADFGNGTVTTQQAPSTPATPTGTNKPGNIQ